MYEPYWGLTAPPFANRFSGKTAIDGPAAEEALARLLYCVEQSKAFALLHGPHGCGKSQLLHSLSHQIRRTQRFLAAVDVAHLSEADFLNQLQQGLRLGGREADSLATHWLRLRDFFQTTKESGVPSVLVLEGLENAQDSVVSAIRRIVNFHDQSAAHVTIIGCLHAGKLSPSLVDLLSLVDMGIEVRPLESQETKSYVQTRLETAGSNRVVFQSDAIEELQRLSGGVPREINRLCDLALLAGMNESQTTIDGNLIAGLAAEHKLPIASR